MEKQESNFKKFKTKGKTKVIEGSILSPQNAGLRFVLSVNNTLGKTDSPWYKLFDKKWPKVREQAKGWYNTKTGAYKLGAVNIVPTQSDTWVIQMLVQDDKFKTNLPGLEESLKKVSSMAKYEQATVHVPIILTEEIPELSNLISKYLIEEGVSVYFYKEIK